ncbi:MAG: NTF2-like protein [Benjaminiella poitrasii]|nr:MAG: NTF2-like protein [Benjaminiella poitrasii]
MNVIVNIAEKSSEQFIQFFYPNYDTQRQNLGNLYRDNSAILWNGNAFSGAQQYSEFLGQLPMSYHEVDVYDCHPLPATMNAQGACGILINTTGTVKYGDNPVKRHFSQTFILMPDEKQAGNYYIQSDNFRFV